MRNRIASLVVGLAMMTGLSATPSVAGEDGFTLLVEAIRNSGRNPAVIHSGRIEAIRRHTNQEMPEAEFQEQLAGYKRHLEERLALFSNGFDESNRRLTLEAIKNAEADRRAVFKALSDQTERYKITFRGVDPFVDVKQRITSAEAGAGRDSEKLLAIGGSPDSGRTTFLRKDPNSPLIRVDRSYAAFPFNEFGRARGATLQFLAVLLLMGTIDHLDYRFNPETIAKTLARLKADGAAYTIQKQVEFEGGTVSVVEMSSRFGAGKTLVWIDPARGCICPKIEEYVGDRVFKSYESSGYFLDRDSGLWWPRSHVETEYDPDTGAVKSRDAYAMTPEGTALNVPIDDDEFAFRARPGMQIADDQEGAGAIYHVADETSLRIKDGVLDLAHDPALIRQGRLGGVIKWSPFTAMNFGSMQSWAGVPAKIAAIALALMYLMRRRSASRAA